MSNDDRFIIYLHSLRHEDSGALAALRRACGQRLAESRNCQWFASVSKKPADFLTAALVAQYPAKRIRNGGHDTTYPDKGSIGAAWAIYCRQRDSEADPAIFYQKRQKALAKGLDAPRPPSIHERFRTLLDADLDLDGTGELAYRLRGLVRMLVAEEIPIDVIQLARDLRMWRHESRCVQERWAKAFYRPIARTENAAQSRGEQVETKESEIEDLEEDEDVS